MQDGSGAALWGVGWPNIAWKEENIDLSFIGEKQNLTNVDYHNFFTFSIYFILHDLFYFSL